MVYSQVIGQSLQHREITAYANFDFIHKAPTGHTLLIGGTHGDERASVKFLQNFHKRFLESGQLTNPVCIIPLLSPDAYEKNSRYNARGVDINRNFPFKWTSHSEENPGTAPLSEPESKSIYDFIRNNEPSRIISLHWALSEIDADGKQSFPLAQKMFSSLSPSERAFFRYKQRDPHTGTSDNPPGSLGSWCGYDLKYNKTNRPSMVTLELPYTHKSSENLYPLPEHSVNIMRGIWAKNPEPYTAVIEPMVHKMLLAASC
ncbi:MAG: succinylglutamate desuccinylase/aspartoacylase family protein [Fibrobacteria bacterium]|nr:succinylglutamate desuccinylase/aspartoacylase family protein [Fibrobacteria bacterium]